MLTSIFQKFLSSSVINMVNQSKNLHYNEGWSDGGYFFTQMYLKAKIPDLSWCQNP